MSRAGRETTRAQQPRLPLIASQKVPSWPKYAGAQLVRYYVLPDILSRPWTSDAHLTGYSLEQQPYRLMSDALAVLDDGVPMVLVIFDVDCELSHAASGGNGEAPAADEWWLGELTKLDELRREVPGAFVYRTRGGYRIVYWLPYGHVLRSKADAQAWREAYLCWIAALRVRHRIFADPACADWTRLFRVPHATRDPGGRPESRDTIGDPQHIGFWTCEPTLEARMLAQTLAKRQTTTPRPRERSYPSVDAGNGVLFYAFKARGWMGDEVDSGKWAVRCPWGDQHTKGTDFDTSTVLYRPGPGETLGWLHCSHAHCQTRDIRDVLACFTREELDQAALAAGLPPFESHNGDPRAGGIRTTRRRQPISSVPAQEIIAQGGLRTVSAKEVTTWRR